MRKDQIESLKPFCQEIVDKILFAVFGELGVTKTSDIVPNADEFLSEMVKSTYGADFSEKDIDEVIAFNIKFKDKNKLGGIRSEAFVNKYFQENAKVIEAMFNKFQGE